MKKAFKIQETPNKIPRFLTISQVVGATGLSRSSIIRLMSKREMPFCRISNRILIPASFIFDLQAKAVRNMEVGA